MTWTIKSNDGKTHPVIAKIFTDRSVYFALTYPMQMHDKHLTTFEGIRVSDDQHNKEIVSVELLCGVEIIYPQR